MKKTSHDAIIKLRYKVWQSNYANFEADNSMTQVLETFGEKVDFDHWDINPPILGLAFYIDGKEIFPYCNLLTLLAMREKRGDYWPAVCSECGDETCAGYVNPVRVFLQDQYIIMVIRRPARPARGRHVYRAYRFLRKNFLEELANAVMTRIRMENGLRLWHGDTAAAEQQYSNQIAALWGFGDCASYQYKISSEIRREKEQLKKNFCSFTNEKSKNNFY